MRVARLPLPFKPAGDVFTLAFAGGFELECLLQLLPWPIVCLQPLHLSQAVRALDQHKFVGLVEAYNSSILLIADIFGLNLTESDFAHARPNPSLSEVCNSLNVRKHRSNKKACLRSMEVNRFDAELYEHTHRSFCRILEDRGLRSHPKVIAEVTRGKLCGDLDFSDTEAYCSHISPQKDLDRIETDQIRCKNKGPNH